MGTGTGSQSAAVFWYLDGQALDWLGQTGPGRGVRVTERRGRQLISTLIIENADMHHAGKFTCAPSYAKPDTVTLHVIDGKSSVFLRVASLAIDGELDGVSFLCVNVHFVGMGSWINENTLQGLVLWAAMASSPTWLFKGAQRLLLHLCSRLQSYYIIESIEDHKK